MAEVIKFYPANAAENADNVLEQAIDAYKDVILIGWNKDGELEIRSTLGIKDGPQALWLIEVFKQKLVAGDYFEVT